MISNVIDSVTPLLTNLCWLERYSGLTRLVNRDVTIEGEKIERRFPVSCNTINLHCGEDEKYVNLVPDSRYKSLMYWEQLTSIADKGVFKRKSRVYEFTARLVTWVNMAALGHDTCSIMDQIYGELSGILNQDYIATDITGLNLIKTSTTEFASWDEAVKVFSKYNYGNDNKLFFNPYDIGAITVRFSFVADPTCFAPIECNDPIECVIY